MINNTPIVFFGSGPVAAESLRLLAKDFNIEAVITKPRAAHHKGDVPVISLARELGLPVHTAANRLELDRLFDTKLVKSQLAVLIDFGIIVSQKVIDYFELGIINSHFSVLPEWRGADPITFAILSGQKQTGVSLMLLVEAMDEGPLLGFGEYDMPDNITSPQLTDHLIKLSHALLLQEIPPYLSGETKAVDQKITARKVSYSRKLTKDDGIIDWSKPAVQIEREIRAFIEWPKSRAKIGSKEVIITQAHAVPVNHDGKPGDLDVVEGLLMVECGSGTLCIDRLKPAGKKEMTAKEFLRGYGQHLTSD